MTMRLTFWHDSTQPDPNEEYVLRRWRENLPRNRKRCHCGRPVPASSLDGDHCAEHDYER